MAFHVACPITCERICNCELGFSGRLRGEKGKRRFLEEVARVEEFLRDPWWVRAGDGGGTVQVLVPRMAPPVGAVAPVEVVGGGDGEYAAASQSKRAALQKQAAEASVAAEDYFRRLEAGETDGGLEAIGDGAGEEQGASVVKAICRICLSGENEGSERAMKMLPCKICNRKYHRSCVKNWAENRDLFHWSSWVCSHCRSCEVCKKVGDPSKLMYCKRCDAAYHCYCQQPPHKNVSRGPYLCPKHTKCHSCGSSVPGSGPSTRWFLSYTCCDACGRLFVKGNYCPVCLKVYRDSESTPMVCCDICQRWVHCSCDGISEEKYQQFQTDGNLHYKCAACRGDCYQVKDIDDAIQELWRRRDKADKDLISNLRAVAGLPYQEDIFSISPFSDDEESGQVAMKSNLGRSLKFSVKGLTEKLTDNVKEQSKKTAKISSSSKKNSKKKTYQLKIVHKSEDSNEVKPVEDVQERKKDQEKHPLHLTISLGRAKEKSPAEEQGKENQRIKQDSVTNSNHDNSKSQPTTERSVKVEPKSEPVKGPKLVIHFGSRSKNLTNSPISEASSCPRPNDPSATNGNEASSQRKLGETESNALDQLADRKGTKHRERETMLKKDEKVVVSEAQEPALTERSSISWRRGDSAGDESLANLSADAPDQSRSPSKGSKPLLKLKFKNLYAENRSSWASQGEDTPLVKKQRSKRKRPADRTERLGSLRDEVGKASASEGLAEEAMDANWILQKLGKGAVGKRVEVRLQSGDSWEKGVVADMVDGTSSLLLRMDRGGTRTLELGKQAIRFISQKHKRTRL
ncbi:uncharacterized protein LOC144702023 isoform X2 [Wolffia australiana]